MTFWDHLDTLRHSLIKALVAIFVIGIAVFCFKEPLFDIIFAPSQSDFLTYRLFDNLTGLGTRFEVEMINIELAQQFIIHIRMSLWVAFLIASPYIIYLLFNFIAPGLYKNEKHYAQIAILGSYFQFLIGILINYFLIFPFTFRFLGTYQVSTSIANQITIQNYINTLLVLSFIMGIVFQLPIISWLLAKLGLLHHDVMKKYRRHAIVLILILSAVITPSGDAFTLSLVALPIYLLYEISIRIVRHTETR